MDREREARAYNNSIYLMVGMPYLLLGGVGLLIYRGYRQRAKELAQRAALSAADNKGNGHASATLPANPADPLPPGGGDR